MTLQAYVSRAVARLSGTEEIYKIYAEIFKDKDHLLRVQTKTQAIADQVFTSN